MLTTQIKQYVIYQVSRVGRFECFVFETIREMIRPPFRWRELMKQLYFVGNQSLLIIIFTGSFTGAVFGLQIGGVFRIFRAEALMGGATGLALAKELAPLVTSFLLTGRAGSAMTAELANMVVTEQVAALEAMGVSPIHYLVVPRVIASTLMMPLLCGVFMLVGIIGALLVGEKVYEVDQGLFIDKLLYWVVSGDVVSGLRKMVVFGLIIGLISCYRGLRAAGGAKGVGSATTQSVVGSLVSLLLVDFFISYVEVAWKL